MKKRKIKLFASVASLAMVAAVMGVGVWAASSQTVTVNSTVGFQATSIAANVKLAIAGSTETPAEGDAVSVVKAAKASEVEYAVATQNAVQIANFVYDADKTTTSITGLHVELQDGDGDGFINAGAKITYSFVITAGSYADGEMTASPVDVDYAVAVEGSSDLFKTPVVTTAQGTITKGQTTTVTVVYELIEKQAAIDTSTSLGAITIELTAANS